MLANLKAELTGQCGNAGLAQTWEWGWPVGVKGPERRREAETGGAGGFLGAGSSSGGGRGGCAAEQQLGGWECGMEKSPGVVRGH